MKIFQKLFLVKIFLLTFIIVAVGGWVKFGEKNLTAQNVPKAASDKKEEPKEEAKKPKSFLESLLNLPILDTDHLKKDELGKYLSLAEKKKAQVDERIVVLEQKEKQLQTLEASIDSKLQKIDDERKFIAQTIQQEKDLKGERLTRLIELYDKMEPKKAAPVFEKLDKDMAVALMKSLKQKQVTTILEFVTPEKGVELSEYYGRVKSMREYDTLKELNQSLKSEFQDCKLAAK